MASKRVTLGFALAGAAAFTLTVRAGQPVNLDVQMGLWEVSAQAQTSGTLPPQAQAQLQSLPPERRARIEAAMQAAMAEAQRGHVFRNCMTPERLSRGFGAADDSPECKTTMVRNTRTDFEYRKVCKSADGTSHTEKAVFHVADRHHVKGTVDVATTEGGHKMTIHQVISGKWLSASCGRVKDSERIK